MFIKKIKNSLYKKNTKTKTSFAQNLSEYLYKIFQNVFYKILRNVFTKSLKKYS